MKNVILDRTSLPVIHGCDAVVVDGSFAGVAAALALARSGRHVTVVESRTYLGREITATLRPWVPAPKDRDLPGLVAACVAASGTRPAAGEIPLHPDSVKRCLENLLLDAGVELLYASRPVGLCEDDGALRGVVIANKSGRQVLACPLLVDATSTALVARLAGAGFEPANSPATYRITLEFDRVAFQGWSGLLEYVSELDLPAHLGVMGNRAVVHRGCGRSEHAYRPGHVLLECALELPGSADTGLDATARHLAAREKAVAVASHLLWESPTFRLATLGTLSHELHGAHARPMAGPVPAWAEGLEGVRVDVGDGDPLPLPAFAAPPAGVWCVNEGARLDPHARESIRDPVPASRLGEGIAHALDARWETAAASRDHPRGVPPQEGRDDPGPPHPVQVREPAGPQRGRRYEMVPIAPSTVPVIAEVDVLVAGGGTSGAIATIAAAQEGARTLVVEMLPGLGGTATYGGVRDYWVGYQKGFTALSRTWVNELHDRLRYPHTYGHLGGWNVEAKIQALIGKAQETHAEILLDALVFGAIVADDVVRGVVAATPSGPVALLGKAVIDATGDGDVAAFAGAEITYGSARDRAVMWYSLPQFTSPGVTRNNFTSMVDVTNVHDYTRAILAGRRRGGRLHDHGSYVTPRESRHVHGDVTSTLNDQLLHRCWPDVISIAAGNNDVKGHASSDWMRMGLIPPNLEIQIPYRCMLPTGLENLLVAGKAVSATHEALPSIRMQPDLENLGGAAGLAAAMAVREGKGLREIDVHALQTRLVEIGVLPEKVLTRRLVRWQHGDEELEALIEAAASDERPLHAYSNMGLDEIYGQRIPVVEVCCSGPQAVPLLEKALERADGAGELRLAQMLALLGSPAGVPVLASALQDRLSGDRLPQLTSHIKHAGAYAPDQAAMPEAAYLLHSLGMARDRRALAVWQRVVDLLAETRQENVWSQTRGVLHYVDALCLGAERLGDPGAIPILQQLHGYGPFHGNQVLKGFQADFLPERAAYLEVAIGRALARCGSPEGVVILIDYLDDVRALLAEQAHDELVAVSGQDHGKDAAAWSEWLEAEGERLEPVPWAGPTEPLAAWEQEILVCEEET